MFQRLLICYKSLFFKNYNAPPTCAKGLVGSHFVAKKFKVNFDSLLGIVCRVNVMVNNQRLSLM